MDREAELVQRLMQLYNHAEIQLWLQLKHPQLGGATPSEAIKAGRIRDVEAIVDRMESGSYV